MTEALHKKYEIGVDSVTAVDGASIEIRPSMTAALVGVSGCGKSTLLNLLGGIDRPDKGSITVGGVDITRLSERDLEEYRLNKIGFVFQMFNLLPALTAVENVKLPMTMAGKLEKGERHCRALNLLQLVGVEKRAHKRPDELSGGEQQRVAIAVALANDPGIILADEPTANLDQANLRKILALLIGLASECKKTILIATHDPRVSSETEIVIKMAEGRISDVLKAENHIRKLVSLGE
ncbi:MAG: ABC transporter ATP-binding protein [Acidobacteria bacterium]|nr:ABC transporter ATP-binding protein [Acidobacteriota bacterium]